MTLGKKSVKLFLLFLILIQYLEPSLADDHYELNLNNTDEVVTDWLEKPVYADHYNESYSQSVSLSSGNASGLKNSTFNISTSVNDRKITISPIEDNHVIAIALCAMLLVIFGIIIVKN